MSCSRCHESTPEGRREVSGENRAFYRPRARRGEHVATPRATPAWDPHDAVEELVERVFKAYGGAKALTDEFNLSYSQLRKWVGDGAIPSLGQILRAVRLAGEDDPFRHELREHLGAMFAPPEIDPGEVAEAVADRLQGKTVTPEDVADAVRETFHEIAPGRWARTR